MNKSNTIFRGLVATLCLAPVAAHAQNWGLVIQDLGAGTPFNEVNGVTGTTATLSATLINYTGTPISDDGTGVPAPATQFDFAGFGWTLFPGQTDLESRFTGLPLGAIQVLGSTDGTTAGDSGYVSLGTFDLTGLLPGTYEQDFSAAAFPTDFNSTVPFDQITGTLRLNVTAPVVIPEPATTLLMATALLLARRKRK